MKLFSAVACLSALLAPAAVLADDRLKVPGENPLFHCPGNVAEDHVKIDSLDLDPMPPKMGNELVINATGTVKTRIEKEAKVHLVVKMGLITIISLWESLCEQVGHVDLECPIKEGNMKIVKTVKLPANIPSGPFTVEANATTADGKPITCLQGTVTLERNTIWPNLEL